jgi:hypothetical protein
MNKVATQLLRSAAISRITTAAAPLKSAKGALNAHATAENTRSE